MAENEFYIDYAKLDDFQRQLIDRKMDDSMLITGSAGSGKSLIALHKAKEIAALGESFSIIVFTETLIQYFKDGLDILGLNGHVSRELNGRVKYLIVDECQDFSVDQIKNMKEKADVLFLFGDAEQTIMSFRDPDAPKNATYQELKNYASRKMSNIASVLGVTGERLYWNYRLPQEVAVLAEKVGNVKDLVRSCKQKGEKAQLIKADSFDEQLDQIAKRIKNKGLTYVGILLPYNTKYTAGKHASNEKLSVEYVKDYLNDKHGFTCEYKYNANQSTAMNLDFHSNNPKIMTWWCAKGLQFKNVFVPGCEFDLEEEKRMALYVAITRCKEHLYVCFSGKLNEFFPDESLREYYDYDYDFSSSELEMA